MTIATEPSKFIWFRVAKTGTRSTLAALKCQKMKFSLEQGFNVQYRPSGYAEYYKFSFVRDPYARIASAWNDKIVNGGQGGGIIEPKERERLLDFDLFLDWVVRQDPAMINNHYRPQSLLVPEGIDDVGRFESYSDDLIRIIERVGLPTPMNIPHHNKFTLQQKKSIWSKRQLDIVSEYYWADFERFGYAVRR